ESVRKESIAGCVGPQCKAIDDEMAFTVITIKDIDFPAFPDLPNRKDVATYISGYCSQVWTRDKARVKALIEEKKAVPNSKAKPAPVEKVEQGAENQGVPVMVVHNGNDVLGGSLALKLKEHFRKSVLFKLAGKDGKAVRVIIESRSEFTERPEIGSVYSVVWTFAESEGVVPFYLKQELGLVNS
ncbi:hypothetical protein ADUPG1_000735, partial [Aduncisulcus paluster]